MHLPTRTQKQKAAPPEIRPDQELAARMLDGDRDALRTWLDAHMPEVFGYLQRRLGPGHDNLASELTTATFERAMKRIKPYAAGSARTPMRLLLLRIAGEQLARKRSNRPATAASVGHESSQLEKIHLAIQGLTPRKQAAVALALFEGLSGRELAAALGMRVPRAMKLLRSALQDVSKALGADKLG